jgi:UDP-3-O-[3-hydroxymyristoyl] glucosamine N-acyltransferase
MIGVFVIILTILQKNILKSGAGVILCNNSIQDSVDPKPGQQLVFVSNPRLAFVQILSEMIKDKSDNTSISTLVSINSSASVEQDCAIGEYSIIGKKVSLRHCIMGKIVLCNQVPQ